mmetsp:Transcript_1896/g.2130  ORF Transcript_1896/g.2130 Transcript_1896/m.2130 type:complete len:190 (+) Transcript_1896:233-802(+)
MIMSSNIQRIALGFLLTIASFSTVSYSFTVSSSLRTNIGNNYLVLHSSSTVNDEKASPPPQPRPSEGLVPDHVEPEEAIIHIAPKAMKRLRELKVQQSADEIVLRMGVRNGGCSGLSYVMDFSTRKEILEDDAVDEYTDENLVCVVDAKSMLYLYGMELDYSDELIGGGFKFFNPNAEESCGCGSSFGV